MRTISIIDGKVVISERPSIEDKQRFLALRENSHYELFDVEQQAVQYLESNGGGKIYRLTYVYHESEDGTEVLPRSKFHRKVVNNGTTLCS